MHFEQEVDAVLVDTAILAAQPTRLFLSGVFDALAKFIEIKHRFVGEYTDYPLGLDWAYVLSAHSYDLLCRHTEEYLAQKGKVTDTVDRMIFATIAATGVISGIARGSNQTALAHKFYELTRVLFYEEARPYLHGEIVGIGLLIQNVFNGEEQENRVLLDLMKKYHMPCSLSQIGVAPTEEHVAAYYEKLLTTSAVLEAGEGAPERLKNALDYLQRLG